MERDGNCEESEERWRVGERLRRGGWGGEMAR